MGLKSEESRRPPFPEWMSSESVVVGDRMWVEGGREGAWREVGIRLNLLHVRHVPAASSSLVACKFLIFSVGFLGCDSRFYRQVGL